MSDTDRFSRPAKPALASRMDDLRGALRQVPVNLLADRTGSSYQALGPGRGEYRLSLFDSRVLVTYPGFVGVDVQTDEELPMSVQAVLAYYFYTSDGTQLSGHWVSFADLPDGRMYNRAFQGYSGDELVKVFGLGVDAFNTACKKGGGVAISIGDAAYSFYALPRLPLLVNYWCGDEDFPSSCKILFDDSVSHYLPTDVCAILGSMLTRRLIKNRLGH
jgi:Domain of unknown function (DUF3786)